MCWTTAAELLLCLGTLSLGGAGLGEPALGAQTDPAALNERAVAYVHQGDYRTARILLERARVIVPGDPVIEANAEALTAFMATPGTVQVKAPGALPAVTPTGKPEPPIDIRPWPRTRR